MRPLIFSAVLLAYHSTPILYAQPTTTAPTTVSKESAAKPPSARPSYDELLKKGEAVLTAEGLNTTNAESAAITLFTSAFQVAPDERRKFEALMRAADVSTQIKDFRGAIKLYDSARSLTKIPAGQKATAQFHYAASLHQEAKAANRPPDSITRIHAEYQAALLLPLLPGRLRIQAHEAIGDLLILRGQRLLGIREYQKILPLPNAKVPSIQDFYPNRIFVELQKVGASPDALAIADSVFKQFLPLQKTPEAIATAKGNFAQILVMQNQTLRAINIWNEIADDKSVPLSSRTEALRKVGAIQRGLKNWPEALRVADRLGALPGALPSQIPSLTVWRSRERAAVFLGQGDEAKARLEWETIIVSPQLTPEEKGRVWMDIADSYGREMKASPQNTALISLQKQAYENVWKLEGAPAGIRTQALLNRGQLDIEAKNPSGAINLLNEGLNGVATWKAEPQIVAQSKRALYLALATIHRSEKNYDKAVAALIQAQQTSHRGDTQILRAVVDISQESFAAKQWSTARAILSAMQDVWGISRKTYLLNQVQIDVAEQKWADARKALDEIATLNPSPEEKRTIDNLYTKIPAA